MNPNTMTIAEANSRLAEVETAASAKIAAAIQDLETLQSSVAEIGLSHVTRLPVIDQAIQHLRFGPLGPGMAGAIVPSPLMTPTTPAT